MSVNKNRPHVLVLPEDDANRQMANGFLLDDCVDSRRIQVLHPAHGWSRVRDEFIETHRDEMDRYPLRHMVLLVDFDGRAERLDDVKRVIPSHLADRVFIVGVWSQPEKLSGFFGGLEAIGKSLAGDCRSKGDDSWNHELLRHNSSEVRRMTQVLRPILFPSE